MRGGSLAFHTTMKRRRLLQLGAALAALPLAPSAALACDFDPVDPAAPAPKDQPAAAAKAAFSRVIARVGRNHGHVFAVTFADVKAGVAKTYDLSGTSGHPHALALSADDMKSLLAGQVLRAQSTRVGGHAHRVLVRCALPVDPPEWVSACEATVGGKDDHEMVITAVDMAAKVEKTYDVQGIAGHSHAVTVTAEDFQKLVKGEALTLTSTTTDAHAHLAFLHYTAPSKT
jgi:hypothetical protein